MELQHAKTLLDTCVRSELRDHAFGDAEVFWHRNGVEVATGYFNSRDDSVSIEDGQKTVVFVAEQARELRDHGVLGDIDRNDETGPTQYHEGSIMPGLTKEAVRHELTDLENDLPPASSF